MIQRLQSIFLLLASGSLGSAAALPYADTETAVADTVFADQIFEASDLTLLFISVLLGAVVLFASIFLYNNRKLQRTVVWAGIGLTVLSAGIAVGKFMASSEALGAVAVDDGPSLYTTVAAVVLSALGIRYINKDEKLVRSADRLR